MRRRKLILFALLATTLTIGPAMAASEAPFSQKEFAAAQQAGKPILVHITASWCPTCTAQKPILDRLAADPAFKDLVIFAIDFDAQKDAVRALGARMQSTLVAFHGSVERGRSVGDTNADSIRALLEKTKS